MNIVLTETQKDEVVISEMLRWYKHIKKDPSEYGDKQLLKAFKCVYTYYTGRELK